MHPSKTLLAIAIFFAACLAFPPARGQDLNTVIQKLNAAARGFHSISANVEDDSVQTDPVPDTDVMKGMAYYDRKGNDLEIAAHFTQHNGQPSGKTYIYSGGVFRVSDTGKEKDAKVYSQASKYESYLLLGFGASGDQLKEKWDMTYLGQETIDGINTDKLKLVAKDPEVRRNIPEVTIWIDPNRAISLKEIFNEGQGQSYQCHYTDIKVNGSLPKDAFKFAK